VCRAVKVLCVGEDAASLRRLKQAVVAAEWELCAGATDMAGALDQIDEERPHALVAFGSFDELLRMVAERFPGMRLVTDRATGVETAVVVGAMSEARAALRGQPRPGGPIR
jgi:hypothetical protein